MKREEGLEWSGRWFGEGETIVGGVGGQSLEERRVLIIGRPARVSSTGWFYRDNLIPFMTQWYLKSDDPDYPIC